VLSTHFKNKSQIKSLTRGSKICMINSRISRAVVSSESLEDAMFTVGLGVSSVEPC
jgi:hypothetical protein